MMVLSTYAKQRILLYSDKGKRAPTIQKKLREEGIVVSRISIWKFLCQYTVSQCLSRKEGSAWSAYQVDTRGHAHRRRENERR